jgi:hypothetical protein
MKDKKDVLAPDGVVAYGDRLVRAGGKIKYAGDWWQDDRLLPYVGQYVGVCSDQYWITHPRIWIPTYPEGKHLFSIGEKGEFSI